jgi:murein DD-endopeptidase MepM/ murein hydrolase activator NlpD
MLENILTQINSSEVYAIDSAYSRDDYAVIDLSVNNSDLKDIDITSAEVMEDYVNAFTESKGAKVAVGGYLEVRNLYARSEYFKDNVLPNKERNIHLGVDIWSSAGTSVLAALEGEVHSFKNNTNHGDYGPTIILKHQLEREVFHTLYGHLSMDSLESISIGQHVAQGEVIARLGDSAVNGDYAPHLHFQIIKDMQGKMGDYPGVCCADDLPFYKSNCPNPMKVLGF